MENKYPLEHWGGPLAVLVIGAFMSILDSSIVNVAVPTLERVFSVGTAQVQWVVTIYLLALGVVVPTAGYLGDRFGYRRMYIISLIVFTIGSGLSGISWSIGVLSIFRVIQALGGGLIMPLTMSMLYRMVPRHQIGTAMGFWGLAIIVAPAIGPTLGGYLVQYVDWRLIFYINVPIGVVGVLLALAAVPQFNPNQSDNTPFDILGFFLVASGLFGLLLAFSEGQTWGWSSEAIVLLLVASVFLLAIFTLWELQHPAPLLQLRVFTKGSFAMAQLLSMVSMVALYSGIFYVPLFLQTIVGYGAMDTGLILMPAAIASAIMMPISGKLFDKFGARPIVAVGLLILAITTYMLHYLTAQTPASEIMLWLGIRGLGMGAAMMPITTAGMSAVPQEMVGSGSSINNVTQRVSGSFGLALLTVYLQKQTAMHAQTLASAYTPTSGSAMQLIHGLKQMFYQQGLSHGQAYHLTTTSLYGNIENQAFVMGMDDLFAVAAAIAFLGFLLTFGLKTYRTRAAKAPSVAAD